MRLLFLTYILTVFSLAPIWGQILNPVSWSTSQEHIGDDVYEIRFHAKIDAGWAIYSQYLESDEGPIPTSFVYENPDVVEFLGKNKEDGHKKEGFDPIFEMNVIKFTDNVTFKQGVKRKGKEPLKGYITYMTCDDERCLPPTDVDFSFTLKPDDSPDEYKGSEQEKSEKGGFDQNDLSPSVFEDVSENQVLNDQQIEEPVQWSASYSAGTQPEKVLFKAQIQDGWYLYSQTIEGDDGPEPTAFSFNGDQVILEETSAFSSVEFDEIFNIELKKFKKEATFSFTITDLTKVIKGEITGMSCDQSKCVFLTPIPFQIDPVQKRVTIGNVEKQDVENLGDTNYTLGEVDLDQPIGKCGDPDHHDVKKKGLWGIFVLGFLGGLLALLTPCVFPMIPLTVSFFTKSSGNKSKGMKQALLYGFFILAVYLILSVPFHLMDSVNPDILNNISTNVVLNISFFLIFLFFAFSFFGYYELTLPSSWTNKVSRAEGIGGMIGIFFMALTLALVSFSCTGPILGSLLAGALTADGGAIQLTAGMGGFGLALALPFALFAAFPSMLSSLPKSGGWLNTVKVVLGFLELALAFKFLSNADLVKRWGILKIEPFLIIWIIIFVGLALYLLGRIKFPHDGPVKKLSFPRLGLGIVSAAFAIYLLSGFLLDKNTGSFKSLTLLSGLAPPTGYSWLHPNKCPNNLDCYKDLEAGLSYARKVNKPVILDFTGHACVNCRKMEEHVWPENEVNKLLRNDFVLISLYVDEKIELPKDEQIVVKRKSGGTRTLRTVGDKWQHFQTETFVNNSQPYYVLLTPDGKLLNKPVGYTPDAKEYAAFLECGLDAYQDLRGKQGIGGL
jgi:thiol:disulfide interchange protein DsbD